MVIIIRARIYIKLYSFQILNAAAGIMACGLVKDLGEGVSLARDVLRSGRANTVLDNWISLSQVRLIFLIHFTVIPILCVDTFVHSNCVSNY